MSFMKPFFILMILLLWFQDGQQFLQSMFFLSLFLLRGENQSCNDAGIFFIYAQHTRIPKSVILLLVTRSKTSCLTFVLLTSILMSFPWDKQ